VCTRAVTNTDYASECQDSLSGVGGKSGPGALCHHYAPPRRGRLLLRSLGVAAVAGAYRGTTGAHGVTTGRVVCTVGAECDRGQRGGGCGVVRGAPAFGVGTVASLHGGARGWVTARHRLSVGGENAVQVGNRGWPLACVLLASSCQCGRVFLGKHMYRSRNTLNGRRPRSSTAVVECAAPSGSVGDSDSDCSVAVAWYRD
jgi:hypothetical protein